MNNPFDYIPDPACDEAFRQLVEKLEWLKKSPRQEDIEFCRVLEEGKMLGVLIAEDREGRLFTLYAFSGQAGASGFSYPGFVEPVFDYLDPEGYFKTKEREITQLSFEISEFESRVLTQRKKELEREKEKRNAEIALIREGYQKNKEERKRRRDSGIISDTELQSMIRQSQFEKAELHRLKKKVASELLPWEEKYKEAARTIEKMKKKRHSDSEKLQKWLFDNFKLLDALGNLKSLSEIFSGTQGKIPPSGSGECCAPKLLQAAYVRNLKPIAMSEYWYGRPKDGEIRRHGEAYPACRGKCLPVLKWMLQGMEIFPPLTCDNILTLKHSPEIIFENEWFCIVNKPSGMLSVPGKCNEKSLQEWLEEHYGENRQVKTAHRLDQDTSGLLIATFGNLAFRTIQSLFALRKIRKTYIADLEGDYRLSGKPTCGRISLPIIPDYYDRPRQRVDHDKGKEAVTDYEFKEVKDGRSRIIFHPVTGRTHQLRVHAASSDGLNMPIVGDPLYGLRYENGSERLHLHAFQIEFTFPIDNHHYRFQLPVSDFNL